MAGSFVLGFRLLVGTLAAAAIFSSPAEKRLAARQADGRAGATTVRGIAASVPHTLDASQKQQVKPRTSTTSGRARALTSRELVALVTRSLVQITTFDNAGGRIGQASGFFIAPGLVATNLHVLQYATQVTAKSAHTGVQSRVVYIQALDVKHDVCLLKLSADEGTPLSVSSNIAVGDEIHVAGNPEGLEATFSRGIVSANRPERGFFQIDAPISPGSSGGPVVNRFGEVVGVATASLVRGQNLNFAVPAVFLKRTFVNFPVPVENAGALAVSDLQRAHLKGPVHTVRTKHSDWAPDATAFGLYAEGPKHLRKIVTYSEDGDIVSDVFFSFPSESLGATLVYEYHCPGIIRRSVIKYARSDSVKEYTWDLWEGVMQSAVGLNLGTSRDLKDSRYADGAPAPHRMTWDRYGNVIEEVGGGYRTVTEYDANGLEAEQHHYSDGKLFEISRFNYEFDVRGNWTRKLEEVSLAGRRLALESAPDGSTKTVEREVRGLGFTPRSTEYREIAYYNGPP